MGGSYSQKRRYDKGYYDCSSFAACLWKKAGYQPAGDTTVEILRKAKEDGRAFTDRSQLLPGDAVVIKGGPPNGYHMGVYIGGGIVRQASSSARKVVDTPLGQFQRPGLVKYVRPKALRTAHDVFETL